MEGAGKSSNKKVHFKEPEIIDDSSEEASHRGRSVGHTLKRKREDCTEFHEQSKKLKVEESADDLLDQAIYERQVEQHNEDLHESRVNNDFTELNEEDARADRECYREIVKRMNALNLDLNLLKDKSSMEIENFLKMYDVFSDRELDRMADDGVDLEGSPYW